MKKNDVLIGSAVALFTYLFYRQDAGINFLLFTILLSVLIIILNPEKLKDKSWWYYCACANITGLAVFVVNSDLSVLAWIAGILVLSGKSFSRDNSILVALFFSVYSVCSFIVFWIGEQIGGSKKEKDSLPANRWKKLWSLLFACTIAGLFFYLYRLSNPLFDKFAASVNFSWLNFSLLFFVLKAFLIVAGLLKGRRIALISRYELSIGADIEPGRQEFIERKDNASLVALLLFVLLNAMLLLTNGLDVINIYITHSLPAGVTLSDFVHQAVAGIVISIVIAISLIAWFFNGWLNFDVAGKRLRLLVYLWIGQSMLVVINTIIRNYWYVQEYQLTHLRIGVFVFLLLCLCGLMLTAIKISRFKSAWRMAMWNFEIWFLLLVMASLVNWDRAITRYNIAHATPAKKPDFGYLSHLSNANLPELMELCESSALTPEEKEIVYNKVNDYYHATRFNQWQSYSIRTLQNNRVVEQLKLK